MYMNTLEGENISNEKRIGLFQGYCETILKKKLSYTHMDDLYDACGNNLWAIDFEGVGIIADSNLKEFEVGHEIYYPGSYYEPDSSDYQEDGKYKTLDEALWKVLEINLKYDYNNWCESQWAEEFIEEGYED